MSEYKSIWFLGLTVYLTIMLPASIWFYISFSEIKFFFISAGIMIWTLIILSIKSYFEERAESKEKE